MGLLSVEGLVAGYSAADEILKGVDLTLDAGEIVSVIGPNGAGKSTLLKVIAGILVPHQGSVRLRGKLIGGRPPRAISALGLAFVPQEQNVFPSMTVRENLEMGGFLDPAGSRAKVDSIFARFPMLAEKRRQAARTLSGGQRQVLAMAMALMVDEPSAGLAPRAAEQLFETIAAIHADGVAIAMVEQNALQALRLAHRGYILVDGRNSLTGPAADLALNPDVRRIFLGG